MAPAQKDIYIAKKIQADLEADPTELLDEYNYQWVFAPILELPESQKDINTIICAIIYSYSPNSNKVDMKQDGRTINENILKGLNADIKRKVFQEFLNQENEKINESLGNYLDTLPSWEFVTIRNEIDYHAKYVRASENEDDFKDLDADKKYKARAEIGRLKKESIAHRQVAEVLLEKIRKDFMITDERVRQEFGVSYVDESVKRNHWSWREFITQDYIPRKNKTI